jgi:hypothetical protein
MNKIQKRGIVMTGAGAKGLYEAGVIHAFHISGMEFDVITGSSIGAMNSVFLAEYLFRKRGLPEDIQSDPEKAVEAMDRLVRQFHHAWLMLPTIKIIDDSESGLLSMLKDDLMKSNLKLSQLIAIGWWSSDPEKGKIPSLNVIVAVTELVKEVIERLGGAGELLRIFMNHRQDLLGEALRTYLARFGMDNSIVPAEDDRKLKDAFTAPITPLNIEHLIGDVVEIPPQGESSLVDPDRMMRDYHQAGIDVRLTRANYRTGMLEESGYLSQPDFIRWLERNAWRLQSGDPDQIPLGSFRLQIPGNANAINAGLASSRFPGLFTPYPISAIYPSTDPENGPLYDLLANWMDGQLIQEALREAYLVVHQDEEDVEARWKANYESWRNSEVMASFFAYDGDSYMDGGVIDHAPSSSVVDAVRKWVHRKGLSEQDVIIQRYLVFPHPEPKLAPEEAESPTSFEAYTRTQNLQSAAKLASELRMTQKINFIGSQAADFSQALQLWLDGLKEVFPHDSDQPIAEIEEAVQVLARKAGMRGFIGSTSDGILNRLEMWNKMRFGRLDFEVDEITIRPEKMPMSSIQLTDRLGYRKQNAIDMLTMGCYNTLWTLLSYLDQGGKHFEIADLDQDRAVLELVTKWTGIEQIPDDTEARKELQQSWRCQRTACVYHDHHCPRGAKT